MQQNYIADTNSSARIEYEIWIGGGIIWLFGLSVGWLRLDRTSRVSDNMVVMNQ